MEVNQKLSRRTGDQGGREEEKEEWGMGGLYCVKKYSYETHPCVLLIPLIRNNNNTIIHQH